MSVFIINCIASSSEKPTLRAHVPVLGGDLVSVDLLAPLPTRLLHLFDALNDLLRRVERAPGWLVAHKTSLRLRVVSESAVLAEVMLAFGDHRVSDGVPGVFTDGTRGRDTVVVLLLLLLLQGHAHAVLPHVPLQLLQLRQGFFSLFFLLLPLLVELPALLVVTAIVQELTGVTEAAISRLLVVLADVGLVIHDESHPHVRRSSHRAVRSATLFARD